MFSRSRWDQDQLAHQHDLVGFERVGVTISAFKLTQSLTTFFEFSKIFASSYRQGSIVSIIFHVEIGDLLKDVRAEGRTRL